MLFLMKNKAQTYTKSEQQDYVEGTMSTKIPEKPEVLTNILPLQLFY